MFWTDKTCPIARFTITPRAFTIPAFVELPKALFTLHGHKYSPQDRKWSL
jgi:hypothetical protein